MNEIMEITRRVNAISNKPVFGEQCRVQSSVQCSAIIRDFNLQ